MSAKKKVWEEPQLVVLAKGTPDEFVLAHCKTMNPNQQITGPDLATQTVCASGDINDCSNCHDRGLGGT